MDYLNIDSIKTSKVKTILQFSIPAIISMVLTSLINIVDGFFMGNYISKDAIAAVNLGLPVIYLYLAVGLMISVGGSVIAGIALGAKDTKRCTTAFNQTMVITVITMICLSVVVFFCFTPMLHILNAQDNVALFFRDYYMIMLLELPVMIINSSLGMFVRSEGNPRYYMNVTVLTVVLNIILDYVFVKPLAFGVKGIAFASLIAASVGFILLVFYFLKRSKVYKFASFKFDGKMLRDTFFNGSSECIGELSMCISMFSYNFVIMRRIGVDGVTAFTIVGYISYIFSMIIIGFGQGSSPIISFSFGSGDKQLARDIRKQTNSLVFGAGLVVIALIICTSSFYSRLFVSDENIQEMVRTGMLIFMFTFLFCGINAVSSFYFTSIGKAKESAIISCSRGLVLLLASIYILPLFLGMNGIWLTSPITEFLTLFLSLIFIKKDSKE